MSIRTHTLWTLVVAMIVLLYVFAPFSWFVQLDSIEYSDICVGDTKQIVTSNRHAIWDINGEAKTLLVFYSDDNLRIETDIRRSSTFTYESDIEHVEFELEWDKPITRVGTYGVQSTETIYPFWFMPVRTFHAPETRLFQVFNVIDCDL